MSRFSRRVGALLSAVGVVILGLLARFGLPGLAGDVAGGALYAVLVYLLVVAAAPRARWSTTAGMALGLVLTVELVQLTALPVRLGELFPPTRLLLGSTFAWLDLVSGAFGVALAFRLDSLWRPGRPRDLGLAADAGKSCPP